MTDWDQRLTQRGVQIVPAQAVIGQPVWRVTKAEWLDESQAGGRHHIYADTLDDQGRRLVGVVLEVEWPGAIHHIVSEPKPGEPYAANFPMSASQNEFSIKVRDGLSDKVTGIGMGADTPGGFNKGIHTATAITFQMQYANVVEPEPRPTVPVPTVPAPDDKWRHTIDFILQWEGGYQAHPEDHGNWTGGRKGSGELKGTKFGISAASYPHVDIVNLTLADAETIYRRDYWERSGADGLPWPFCLLVMDTAVLHGVGAATSWLRETGPNPYKFAAKRLRVYTGSNNWGNFGRGWTNRTASLLEKMGG